MKKSFITSIISGAVFAISFVLAKKFISKKIINKRVSVSNNQRAPMGNRRHKRVKFEDEVVFNPFVGLENLVEEAVSEVEEASDVSAVGTSRTPSSTVDEGVRKKSSNGAAQTFFIDYPKSSIAGATSLIYNNMVMIDSGSFTRSFGMDSLFNREKETLTILYGDNTLIYNMKDGSVKFNNEVVETDQYAVFFNDLIFIPLPFTAEIFGIGVEVKERDRIIEIG